MACLVTNLYLESVAATGTFPADCRLYPLAARWSVDFSEAVQHRHDEM
jgi:hypothetical protein